MTPERWNQVKQLFEAALAQDASSRAAWLTAACAGDEELHRQIKAMLSADQAADELLDHPAYAASPELLNLPGNFSEFQTEPLPELLVGRRIGAYKLMRELGRGGMGEVYLAHDSRLGRNVALKLLPARFTQDEERVRRFQREARAASALNHPNILTIFDIGQEDGRHYIAAEFVEGQTLRTLISGTSPAISQILDAVLQITAALAAAHRAGIIHRDIKPENVMLRPDSYVKVLDFGLAKLTERHSFPSGEGVETNASEAESLFETKSGLVMGTINYMSTEQAKGEKVDARTDIFSLGVMLYEWITGHHPFTRNSRAETIVALLEHEPPPLAQYRSDLPPELQRIVTRTLAKDRAQRYASIDELHAELRRVKQLLDAAEVSGGDFGNARITAGGAAAVATDPTHTVLFKGRKRVAVLTALAAIVLIIGSLFAMVSWFGGGSAKRLPFEHFTATKFGSSGAGTISPDGRYVVYVETDTNEDSTLTLRQINSGGTSSVVKLGKERLWGLAFTPNSEFIYYVVADDSVRGRLYRVPHLGGTPRHLFNSIDSIINAAFTPDGKRLVYSDQTGMVLANTDGTERHTLWQLGPQSRVWGYAISPDGQRIAYAVRDYALPEGRYCYLAERSIDGSGERMIIPPQVQHLTSPQWLPEGRGLVIHAMVGQTGLYQFFHVAYPGGTMRRITQDTGQYNNGTLTADGRTMLVGVSARPSAIWLAPFADPGRAKQLTPGLGEYGRVSWTPDAKLIYSRAIATSDLWQMNADGSQSRQLTTDGGDEYPGMTGDGRYIFFSSTRSGRSQVWRCDADGGNLRQMTTGGAYWPACSPDGKWLVYQGVSELALWKMPGEGGAPEKMFDGEAAYASFSPDGKLLAYYLDAKPPAWSGVVVIPFSGGPPLKQFDLRPTVIGWTPNSHALLLVNGRDALHSIALQPLDGPPLRTVLRLPNEAIFSFALSPDGKQLAYTSGRRTQDLVLIKEAP